ncbi:MAG: hypothetical protein ACOCP8_01010 [archaeon]
MELNEKKGKIVMYLFFISMFLLPIGLGIYARHLYSLNILNPLIIWVIYGVIITLWIIIMFGLIFGQLRGDFI